jgi:hydrophobe/amphiphile efflux-1 (HAE1) family protein
MNLSGPFIRRPIATSLLAGGLLLAGSIAFLSLPVASLPQIEFPTLSVTSVLPGADPETVATSVSAPLERRFAEIAGVSELTSTSNLGSSSVAIQFNLNRNIDGAERDVQAAINAASGDLPPNLISPPAWRNFNPSDSPILILALTSSTLAPGDVYNYANDVIAQQLAQVKGVGQVSVNGAQKSAVRIQVDPAYLASMGLSMENVRTFLSGANANLPKGRLDGDDISYFLKVNDQLEKAEAYQPLVAFQRKGVPVRLSNLGHILDSTENTRQAGWYNGAPAVLLIVFKQPGANVIETVDRIRGLIPMIKRWMPPAIALNIQADRTLTIRSSVANIEVTLLISVLLVVMVVFVFLRRFWATVIPSCTVPLALGGTFGIMYLAGYTLDNLSLMALAVAVGFVVDDAIVVIENIVRYLEAGDTPFDAAIKGAQQICFTVLSITISLVAVFIPLIFMTGLVGRLLHEFAVTLTAAIVVSGVVSLTFTPMMCSRFLKHEPDKAKESFFFRWLEAGFNRFHQAYERALRWVLGRQRLMLGVTIGAMVATVFLYVIIPKGFFPNTDTGQMRAVFEGAQDISFTAFTAKEAQMVKIILADPTVATVGSFIGGAGGPGGGSPGNQGFMFISLKPLAERKVDIFKVVARLRQRLSKVEGVTLFMQPAQDLRVGARQSKSTFQYTLTGSDFKELSRDSDALLKRLQKLRHFQDVTSDLQAAGLQANIVIDRDAASRLGVTLAQIDNTLYDAFGQRQVGIIYESLSQHHIVLEAVPQYQLDPSSLAKIFVQSRSGKMVPIGAVAKVERVNATLSVNHQGQFPAVTISFNLDEGYSLSDATAAIAEAANEMHMPGSIHGSFQGTAQVFEDSLASEPILILSALIAVYIILGMLYESLIHPLTILSTLPSAGVGALLALLVTGHELDVVGIIGIILLIGLVKKNAIIMIDFAIEAERRHGLSPEEAIFRACIVRFRPIMMTTSAALFGALPLALERGVGAELHRPLGISIVGGLIVSQMLTLFTTPVVYLALDRMRLRVGRRRAAKRGAARPSAGASVPAQ